jgi:hypothetical protein
MEVGDRHIYETCGRCERRCTVTFAVTKEVWQSVSSGFDRLCTICFDELADQLDVPYTFLEIIPLTWSQGFYGEWPHLDVPCAECAGRAARKRNADRRKAEDLTPN